MAPVCIRTVLMTNLLISGLPIAGLSLSPETYRRWNRLCLSLDFDENEAQVSFNGEVSAMMKDPLPTSNPKGVEKVM